MGQFSLRGFFFQKSLLRYIVKQIIYGDPGGSSYCAEAMLFYNTVVSNCSRNTNNIFLCDQHVPFTAGTTVLLKVSEKE